MLRITLNGEPRELSDARTVADLLTQMKVEPLRVAVEINEQIVRRHAFSSTPLAAGDRVEIVTLVGGG